MCKMKNSRRIFLFCVISFVFVSSAYSQSEIARDSVIQYAHNYLKVPYRLGGSSPKAFDCSGFTSYVYRNFGYDLYRTANDQIKNSEKIVERTELKPGDLVFFKGRNAKKNRIGHVGIVVESDEDGGFHFIHASCKYGVTVTDGNKHYYKTRFVAAGRIVGDRPEPLELLPATPVEVKVLSPVHSKLLF